MHKAFDAACARLELSTGTGDRLTELVASRIIELAMDGEWNAERLTARTLAEFGIGNDGSLTGYRWGVERKKRLLAMEGNSAH